MIHLPGCSGEISIEDVDSVEKLLTKVPRPRKRLTELMLKAQRNSQKTDEQCKRWQLVFNRTPTEIIAEPLQLSVTAIETKINRLIGDELNPTVEDTGERETIPCGIIFKSIGYKSIPLSEELPFDHAKGVILQKDGRVDGLPGLFCCGWVASGPVGVIASTLQSGHDVGRNVLKDLRNGLGAAGPERRGRGSIFPLLSFEPVTFSQWETLDAEERQRGKRQEKPREKVTSVEEMLHIINTSPVS